MECSPQGKISISLPGAMPDSIKFGGKKPEEKFEQLKLNFKKTKRK